MKKHVFYCITILLFSCLTAGCRMPAVSTDAFEQKEAGQKQEQRDAEQEDTEKASVWQRATGY